MSIFDPHGVYTKKQKITHDGQILQASPQPRDFGFSNFIDISRFPKYISDLQSMGYFVYPPGENPENTPFSEVNSFSMTLQLSNVSLPRHIRVNDVLTTINNQGGWPTRNFEPAVDSVDTFYFAIKLESAALSIITSDQASIVVNGSFSGRGAFNFPSIVTSLAPVPNDFAIIQYDGQQIIRACDKTIDIAWSPTAVNYVPLYQRTYTTAAFYSSLKNNRKVPNDDNSSLIYWGTPELNPLETPLTVSGFITVSVEFYTYCVDVQF